MCEYRRTGWFLYTTNKLCESTDRQVDSYIPPTNYVWVQTDKLILIYHQPTRCEYRPTGWFLYTTNKLCVSTDRQVDSYVPPTNYVWVQTDRLIPIYHQQTMCEYRWTGWFLCTTTNYVWVQTDRLIPIYHQQTMCEYRRTDWFLYTTNQLCVSTDRQVDSCIPPTVGYKYTYISTSYIINDLLPSRFTCCSQRPVIHTMILNL